MSDCTCATIDGLREKCRECHIRSAAAISGRPGVYREICRIIRQIDGGPVDIDAYFEIAVRLSGHLKEMGPGTLFYNYFYEHIDPCQYGNARFFRSHCRDLLEQIQALERWRKSSRRLRLVKKG